MRGYRLNTSTLECGPNSDILDHLVLQVEWIDENNMKIINR